MGPTKTIAYLRVSTIEQDVEKNKSDILHLANKKELGKVKWVEELVVQQTNIVGLEKPSFCQKLGFYDRQKKLVKLLASGRISWWKREIAQVLEGLQSGDNLIVSELSRLGRSMLECMEIPSIACQKHINIYAVKGNWQLDQSIQSKILAMAFAMASDVGRDLISQRTKEALAAGKRAGKKLGRSAGSGKSKLDKHQPEIESLLANGSTQRFIAKRFGTTEANLSRWLKKHDLGHC